MATAGVFAGAEMSVSDRCRKKGIQRLTDSGQMVVGEDVLPMALGRVVGLVHDA